MMSKQKLESVEVKTFAEYQKAAMRTCTQSSRNPEYMALGLISEAGEVVGKVAKMIRDDDGKLTEKRKEDIIAELGDVMWMTAGIFAVYPYQVNTRIFEKFDLSQGEAHLYARKSIIYLSATLNAKCAKIGREVLDKNFDRHYWDFESIVKIIATLAVKVGSNLLQVCQHNIDKLTDRYNRNVIGGNGDNR